MKSSLQEAEENPDFQEFYKALKLTSTHHVAVNPGCEHAQRLGAIETCIALAFLRGVRSGERSRES